MSYNAFAKYYDVLTQDIDYRKRAEYFGKVFERYECFPETVLDVACGTGSLSVELAGLGYNVVAVDSSLEMLTQAYMKLPEEINVLYINQDMQELDIPQKAGAAVCALDSLNHLPDKQALAAVFKRLSLCLEKNAVFVFDVNTLYKHREILSDNAYIFELGEVFCAWQNQYDETDGSVEIFLDFFTEIEDGLYHREQEAFREVFFSDDVIRKTLEEAGFSLIDVFAEDSFKKPDETQQRLVYIAKLMN